MSDGEGDGYPSTLSKLDPHKRSTYLPYPSLHPSSALAILYRHSSTIALTVLVVVAVVSLAVSVVLPATSASLSSASVDSGGATSGRDVHLYRLRAAASYPLPSSFPSSPYPSLSSLVSSSAPGLSVLLRCVERSGGRLAVMTSISPHPTAAEVGLTLLTQPWCVCVIGDSKGPTHAAFTHPTAVAAGITAYASLMTQTAQTDTAALSAIDPVHVLSRLSYIDVVEQRLLPYALAGLTPYGSFSRKNIGFLLAFHTGAQVIFDVDDDNIYLPNTATTGNADLPVDLHPLDYRASSPLDLHARGKVLLDSSTVRAAPPTKVDLDAVNVTVFNPYPLYGAEDAWPRGFPLNWVKPTLRADGHYDKHCLTATRHCRAVVQQWLANQDPDVDAIFRLTNERGMPFYFLAPHHGATHGPHAVAAPSVALGSHTFTPFNAQATIITSPAFFAMLLPFTVHGRVSDIWRSYILETLLTYYTVQEGGRMRMRAVTGEVAKGAAEPCVVFTPPHIYHDRNAHDYQRDFNSELPLYMSAEALLSWLTVRQRGGPKDLLDGKMGQGDADKVMADVMWRLYVELYEAQVVEQAELDYVQAWLRDVARIPIKRADAGAAPTGKQQQQHTSGCFPSYHNTQS